MIKGLLRRAGLMGSSDEGGVRISDEGFRFLLMDVYKQLWVMVREYVAEMEVRNGAVNVSDFTRIGRSLSR